MFGIIPLLLYFVENANQNIAFKVSVVFTNGGKNNNSFIKKNMK